MALSKRLTIVRHGQAQHNPRAEHARANGCSLSEFFDLMREDDVLDAALTDLGHEQAAQAAPLLSEHAYDLIVSSPLSRALQTANGVYPNPGKPNIRRLAMEDFREINGDMLNARRRAKSALQEEFPGWDWNLIQHEQDVLWTEEMEAFEAAAERGYRGLCDLLDHPECVQSGSILLVSHGGLLRYTMTSHPCVQLRDERNDQNEERRKEVDARFDNCEVRHYTLRYAEQVAEDGRKIVLLIQVGSPTMSTTELKAGVCGK